MLGTVFNTMNTLLEGVETIVDKGVKITDKTLDIVEVEVDTSLQASRATRTAKIALAVAESNYDLQKAELKLSIKMSALEKLAAEHNPKQQKEGN